MMTVAAAAAVFGAWAETETVGGYTWTYRINGGMVEIYNNRLHSEMRFAAHLCKIAKYCIMRNVFLCGVVPLKRERPMEESKKKVYLETSFVSYLTGRATTRESIASWQAASRQWWEAVCPSCDLFVSRYVVMEAEKGDAEQVARRIEVIRDIPKLMTHDTITFETPIDEIYRIRQEISAAYDHDPHKLFLAVVEQQKQRAREGQVYWGYNAAGELAPLPMEAICGATA